VRGAQADVTTPQTARAEREGRRDRRGAGRRGRRRPAERSPPRPALHFPPRRL